MLVYTPLRFLYIASDSRFGRLGCLQKCLADTSEFVHNLILIVYYAHVVGLSDAITNNLFITRAINLVRYMYIPVSKFIVEVPQSEGFWKIVEQFEEEAEAKRYADLRFGSVDGVFNSIVREGKYYTVKIPALKTHNEQPCVEDVEGFQLLEDAIDFVLVNYGADLEGGISLVKERL